MREPRVALESAVLTHGLPYPLNLEVALALEEAVREEGATPKTIALVRGEVRVGLSPEEMEALAAGAKAAAAEARWALTGARAEATARVAEAETAKASTAARLSLKPRANGAAALKATGSVATKAARGSVRVLAGRFETERTYIMIKPDGVQRGYVRLPPVPIARDADSECFSFLSRHPPRRPTRPAE